MPSLREYAADEPSHVPAQHWDDRIAADEKHSRKHVQDMHEQQVLGVHGKKSAPGALGDDFRNRHPDLYDHEHGDLCFGLA